MQTLLQRSRRLFHLLTSEIAKSRKADTLKYAARLLPKLNQLLGYVEIYGPSFPSW